MRKVITYLGDTFDLLIVNTGYEKMYVLGYEEMDIAHLRRLVKAQSRSNTVIRVEALEFDALVEMLEYPELLKNRHVLDAIADI